mgnify:CR=1 FL=1
MSTIFIGKDTDGVTQELLLNRANRHGLVAGATGTGKTVTLQILSEGFSKAGVPVFAADVKGDLSGLSQAGSETHKLHDKLIARARKIGLISNDYEGLLSEGYGYAAMPTIFWDLYGKQGHPVRTTISEMGPVLLSRLMGLNETQEGILTIAFELADDEAMLLLDLKDLRALLNFLSDNKKEMGGLSGKPLTNRSTEVIRFLADKSNKAFPIIGVGGIHSAQDALEKIEAGADLVQIYTGFIYEGPSLIKRINKALLKA